MRELAGAPAERAVQGEQVHRRVMHADADALFAHRGDEPGAVCVPWQHDLKHVPVRVLEVFERELALERAVPALEVASGKLSPSVGEFLQMGKLPKTEASGDVGEVDRKSTRLNSSHRCISYAVFCLKKKNKNTVGHSILNYIRRFLIFHSFIQLILLPCYFLPHPASSFLSQTRYYPVSSTLSIDLPY